MSDDKNLLQFPNDRKPIDLSGYKQAIGLEF